jgi:hypothetical protein
MHEWVYCSIYSKNSLLIVQVSNRPPGNCGTCGVPPVEGRSAMTNPQSRPNDSHQIHLSFSSLPSHPPRQRRSSQVSMHANSCKTSSNVHNILTCIKPPFTNPFFVPPIHFPPLRRLTRVLGLSYLRPIRHPTSQLSPVGRRCLHCCESELSFDSHASGLVVEYFGSKLRSY